MRNDVPGGRGKGTRSAAGPSEVERLRAQVAALRVERTRLQEALQRSDERFINTVGSCNNWSFEVDSRFRFTLTSNACEPILGYRAEELIGRPLFSLMSDAVRAVLEPVLREHAAARRKLDLIEATLLHRNGTPVHLEFNAVPFASGKGRLAGYQGIIRNLSDPYRMLAELERSEVRYRALFESITQGVLFFSPEMRLLAANPAAQRAFALDGGSLEGITGEELAALCVAADGRHIELAELPLMSCAREGRPVLGTTLGRLAADGSIAAWFLVDAVPIRRVGEAAAFLYLMSFTDITAQVAAQNAFRERESRLQAIFEAALDVSLIVTDLGGADARVLEFSPGAERIFGYTQEEMVGRPVSILHPSGDAACFPEVIAAMAAGQPGFSGEGTLVRKSGEEFAALFTTRPVFDGFGHMVATLGVSMDISHIRKAEAELEQNRAQLSDAQRLAQMGYWEWDIRSDRMIWSEELQRIFGPGAEPVDYDSFLNFVHPEDRDRVQLRIRRAVNREKDFSLDFRMVDPAGRERHIHSEADVTFDGGGHAVRLAGMVQDITERKRIENRYKETARRLRQQARHLEEVNAELQQFIYVMAHDLKAPLRAVSNLATWLQEDLGEGLAEEHRRQLALLRGRVQRMHGLIQALLNYSRAGRQTQVSTVDTGRLLREVVASLSVPAGFSVEIPAEMPVFITDRLCLAQVFSNLVSNAVEHHPRREGRVGIRHHEDRKHHIFSVSDDGKGIAPEYHEKIFEMFQTLEARDKTERTGIGLALVRKLVTGAGGKVTVDSKVGVGTTFKVYWPKRLKVTGQFPWRSSERAQEFPV